MWICCRFALMPAKRKDRLCAHKKRSVKLPPRDARNAIGRMYEAWCRLGKSPSSFEEVLSEAGYHFTRQTLNNLRRLVREGAEPIGDYSGVGRPASLDAEETEVVVGHCLEKSAAGECVSPHTLCQHFQVNILV